MILQIIIKQITTRFSTMTMGIPTNRARKLIKLLERLIKQDHLYTEEKIIEMKKQLHVLKNELAVIEEKTSKGFGK